MSEEADAEVSATVLRVVRGDATPEEVAALVAVVQAAAAVAPADVTGRERVGQPAPGRPGTADGGPRWLARERPAGLIRSPPGG